jgi:GT2 family glycosyltransferase
MSIAVIVPGLNVASMIGRCLTAIAASHRVPDEIIFFDDGSTDDSASIAAAQGVRVIRHDGPPIGPGMGRNRAVGATHCDLIMFIDADIVIHPTAIGLLAEVVEQGDVVAAFGSYDDRPPERGVGSLYFNLRHHFVHQNGPVLASTFWAGIGLVRHDAFDRSGGFSAIFGRPSIEDIELGARMVAEGGKIQLVRAAQGTHLKRWSLGQLWRTDVFQRAIPWSRLIADGATPGADLNAAPAERVSAVLAHVIVLSMIAIPCQPLAIIVGMVAAFAYGWQNRHFFCFLSDRVPIISLPGIIGLHWLYHLYSSQVFVWVMLLVRLRRCNYGAIKGSAGI